MLILSNICYNKIENKRLRTILGKSFTQRLAFGLQILTIHNRNLFLNSLYMIVLICSQRSHPLYRSIWIGDLANLNARYDTIKYQPPCILAILSNVNDIKPFRYTLINQFGCINTHSLGTEMFRYKKDGEEHLISSDKLEQTIKLPISIK